MGLGIEICGVVDLSLIFLGLRSLGIEFNFVFWFKLSDMAFLKKLKC